MAANNLEKQEVDRDGEQVLISVRIPRAVDRRIEGIAFREERSKREIIVDALILMLELEKGSG